MCDPIDEESTAADDVIEEVRAARRALWAQFDDDPVQMVAYLMEKQKLHADRLWDPRTRDKQDKSAA